MVTLFECSTVGFNFLVGYQKFEFPVMFWLKMEWCIDVDGVVKEVKPGEEDRREYRGSNKEVVWVFEGARASVYVRYGVFWNRGGKSVEWGWLEEGEKNFWVYVGLARRTERGVEEIKELG